MVKVGHVGSHRNQSLGGFNDVFVPVDVSHVSWAAPEVSVSAADIFNSKTAFLLLFFLLRCQVGRFR